MDASESHVRSPINGNISPKTHSKRSLLLQPLYGTPWRHTCAVQKSSLRSRWFGADSKVNWTGPDILTYYAGSAEIPDLGFKPTGGQW